ncbi:helix-turn-helix transcriptional regulator [Maridesulfovibrio zosterae]|uniref:helix-turn-helix transcriptional regulator n=1 Tax=Maridesulfovibrio zosterae TaxID=82171 RepID=UPI00042695AB|nr:PAS domain-containing protein [Maridesulfovibrio zosterae]
MNFLEPFIPVVNAISALLHPHAEVVIHDLENGKIFFISNSFSRRKSGDPSMLGNHYSSVGEDLVYHPFSKTGNKGETIRSVSAVLKTPEGLHRGLLCINMDVSKFEKARELIGTILGGMDSPKIESELFDYDWQEQMNLLFKEFLVEKNIGPEAMNRNDRKDFVHRMKEKGLLQARKSISFLADILNVTKATVYNYLNEEG